MNIKSLILSCLIFNPLTHATQKPHEPHNHVGTIPFKDIVLHIDEDELRAELKKYKETDPALKMTYIIAGSVVTVAAITGAVILTVHFNQ